MLILRSHPSGEVDSARSGGICILNNCIFRNLLIKQIPSDLAEFTDPTLRNSALDGELIWGGGFRGGGSLGSLH